MPRRLFTFMSALSLLLCMATITLWIHQQRRATGDAGDSRSSVYLGSAGGRHSIVSDNRGLTLWAPPAAQTSQPAPPPSTEIKDPMMADFLLDTIRMSELKFAPPDATPASLAAGMRNDQLVWEVRHYSRIKWDGTYDPHFSPRGTAGSPTQTFAPYHEIYGIEIYDGFFGYREADPAMHRPFTAPQAARALLDALDDPDRWIAAHFVLTRLVDDPDLWDGNGTISREADGSLKQDYHGLKVVLRPLTTPARSYQDHPNPADYDYYAVRSCEVAIDASQQVAIRDHWHRRLDTKVASASYVTLTAVTAVLPAVWFTVWCVSWRRRRSRCAAGHCVTCGYDLRESPRRCPECGAATTKPAA